MESSSWLRRAEVSCLKDLCDVVTESTPVAKVVGREDGTVDREGNSEWMHKNERGEFLIGFNLRTCRQLSRQVSLRGYSQKHQN